MPISFLKKLGRIVAEGLRFVVGLQMGGLVPAAQAGIAVKVKSDLEILADIIAQVEAVGAVLGTPGADKLRAAGPLVTQAVLQSALLAGRKIADPALVLRGSTKIADGMVDILNGVEPKVETS